MSFAQMIDDPPAGDMHHPTFERADLGLINKIFHLSRNANDGLLDHVFSVRVGQAILDGGQINEFPISVEELLPRAVIIEIAQALEQTEPGGRQFFQLWGSSYFGHSNNSYRGNQSILTGKLSLEK